MKTNTHKAKSWVILSLLSLGMVDLSCLPQSSQPPAPLPVNFKFAGHYSIVAIQIDPVVQGGQDIIAMYADSTGQSPCLSGTTIRFDSNGWVTFTKPLGCEQNDDLSQITGLTYGDRWSIQDNMLLVDNIGQTSQYNLTVNGDQVFLSWDVDKGYTSSLDDNPPGFTLTLQLKRL